MAKVLQLSLVKSLSLNLVTNKSTLSLEKFLKDHYLASSQGKTTIYYTVGNMQVTRRPKFCIELPKHPRTF
ncbi:lysine-specific demethylase 8 [Spatholobus suberectus]|nr:lysine-specific demethylase 8 [Spatholobus suberectus]